MKASSYVLASIPYVPCFYGSFIHSANQQRKCSKDVRWACPPAPRSVPPQPAVHAHPCRPTVCFVKSGGGPQLPWRIGAMTARCPNTGYLAQTPAPILQPVFQPAGVGIGSHANYSFKVPQTCPMNNVHHCAGQTQCIVLDIENICIHATAHIANIMSVSDTSAHIFTIFCQIRQSKHLYGPSCSSSHGQPQRPWAAMGGVSTGHYCPNSHGSNDSYGRRKADSYCRHSA
jgi:hypothetical protein